jgi:hypothetical protein
MNEQRLASFSVAILCPFRVGIAAHRRLLLRNETPQPTLKRSVNLG